MSSDNFYVVNDNKVWMGFASDFEHAVSRAEVVWYRKLLRCKPIFVGRDAAEAATWAHTEYAEYGVWPLPLSLREGETSDV